MDEDRGDLSVEKKGTFGTDWDGLQRFFPWTWGSNNILHRVEEKFSFVGLINKGGPPPGCVGEHQSRFTLGQASGFYFFVIC